MAHISKIVLPDSSEYDIKDSLAVHKTYDYRISGAAGWYKFFQETIPQGSSNATHKIVLLITDSGGNVRSSLVVGYLRSSTASTGVTLNLMASVRTQYTDIAYSIDNETISLYYNKTTSNYYKTTVQVLYSGDDSADYIDPSSFFQTTAVSELPSGSSYATAVQDGDYNVIKDTYATKTEVGALTAADIGYSNTTSGLTATNTQAAIDEINSKKIYYGTSVTSASTQTKTCDITGISSYYDGLMVRIRFANAQTYNGVPKLDINNLGAKNIYRVGANTAIRYEWPSGTIIDMVFNTANDGWEIVRGGHATTSYYGLTKLSSSTTSTATDLAATPSAVKDAYDRATMAITDIASEEASSTASKAYAIGDYLILFGVLYEVIVAIASGETITVGTNVTAVNVMDTVKEKAPITSGVYYGISSTAASTQAKTATVDGVTEYYNGLQISIYFVNYQGYNGTPTLNVNNLGARDIYYRTSTGTERYEWSGGEVVNFVFFKSDSSDAGTWRMVNRSHASETSWGVTRFIDTNTNNSSNLAVDAEHYWTLQQRSLFGLPAYDSTATYAIGDRVRYGSYIYRCTTAITTAEAWNSSHWIALPDLLTQSVSKIPTYKFNGDSGWYRFLTDTLPSSSFRKIIFMITETNQTVRAAIVEAYFNRNTSNVVNCYLKLLGGSVLQYTDLGYTIDTTNYSVSFYYNKISASSGYVTINLLQCTTLTGNYLDLLNKWEATAISGTPTGITYADPYDDGAGNVIKDTYEPKIVIGTITFQTTWSGTGPYTQTVTVEAISGGTAPTITTNSKISLQPTASQFSTLLSDGITAIIIENNNGTLTANAFGATNSALITIQCTVTEVSS